MIKKFWLLVITSALIAGCTTAPVKFAESKSVPSERIYDGFQNYATPSESSSTVIIVRDSGLLGSAGSASIFVNGEIITRLKVGESIVLNVPAGDNILGSGPGTKLKWESDDVGLKEQTLFALQGKTYYYRLRIAPSGGLELYRSSQLQ